MGDHSSYDDLGPGLHVLREAEPLQRAGAMAAHLRAELCATLPQAESTLAERSSLPVLDAPMLSTLEVLARRVARAERIEARTRERAVTEVGQRLAGAGAALAVHPTTIRDRAAAVEAARAALTSAEHALAAHLEERAKAEEAAEQEAARARAAAADAAAQREREREVRRSIPPPRVRRSRSLGVIIAAFGLGLVLLALRAVPLWAALLPTLAACLWALWYLKPREADDAGERAAASDLLAEVAASTDEVFGRRVGSQPADDVTVLRTADRDRAEEQLRVAERAWHELAGDDTDVTELEEVVRRFDPQHEDARLLAGETVGVRAAGVVLHHFQQRWVATWRELGLDPPAPEAGEAAVRDLASRVSRPIVLVGAAIDLGPDLARAAPAAPVVVVDGPIEGVTGEPG